MQNVFLFFLFLIFIVKYVCLYSSIFSYNIFIHYSLFIIMCKCKPSPQPWPIHQSHSTLYLFEFIKNSIIKVQTLAIYTKNENFNENFNLLLIKNISSSFYHILKIISIFFQILIMKISVRNFVFNINHYFYNISKNI